tara:strand:+ start:3530 stop:3991 length:462 start_codon:yes stop_codon:yes gene_type:complete
MEHHMRKTLKIGWQKYEDVLESQINSPIIDQLYQSMIKRSNEYTNLQDLSEEELEQIEEILASQLENPPQEETLMLNIDENLAGEISLASNFDCWVAHTNFNLTESIRDELDSVEGVELLKIFSRYRFLVGVGRMFDFKEVRKEIEKIIPDEK